MHNCVISGMACCCWGMVSQGIPSSMKRCHCEPQQNLERQGTALQKLTSERTLTPPDILQHVKSLMYREDPTKCGRSFHPALRHREKASHSLGEEEVTQEQGPEQHPAAIALRLVNMFQHQQRQQVVVEGNC